MLNDVHVETRGRRRWRRASVVAAMAVVTSLGALATGGPAQAGEAAPQWPVTGSITQLTASGHGGLDIGAPVGNDVVAVQDGTVTEPFLDPGGYGWNVVIDHGGAWFTLYGHVSEVLVDPGDVVAQGDLIAKSGGAQGAPGAGNSGGPHVHFEFRQGTNRGSPIRSYENGQILDGQGTTAGTAMPAFPEGFPAGGATPPPPPVVPVPFEYTPVSIVNPNGLLEVFATDQNGILLHQYQVPGTASGWSGWASLDVTSIGKPTVIENPNGLLEVFVTDHNGDPKHSWQDPASFGGWRPFIDVAGDGHKLKSSPVVVTNPNGVLELFAADTADRLVHSWQVGGNTGWSNWADLGASTALAPDVVTNPNGVLEAFVTAPDGAVWHAWQNGGPSGWSAFQSLNGENPVLKTSPVVVTNPNGKLEVFGATAANVLVHAWQAPGTGWGWSGFQQFAGIATGLAPDVIVNPNGKLEVFVTDTSSNMQHSWQTSVGTGWSAFQLVEAAWPFRTSPSVVTNPDGLLEVFAIDANNGLTRSTQQPTLPTGWTPWAPLGTF